MLFSFANASPAHASVGIVVNSNADMAANDGACTLREAILNANGDDQSGSTDCIAGSGADTITFDSSLSNATITLGSLLPNITDDLTISGSSLTLPVTIDGAGTYRVLYVDSVTVTLDSLIISHGASSNGGGLYNNGGTLNITDSTFSDNSTACTGNLCNSQGGGIYNDGTLNITNSTFSENSTTCTGDTNSNDPRCASDGGGIYNYNGYLTVTNSTFSGNSTTCYSAYCYSFGSGIFSSGTLTVANSTFSGNRATCTAAPCYSEGGGLINHGTLNITNSTFSDNSATCTGSNCFSLGGGIRNGGTLTGGTLTVTNSTFSGNSAACTGQSCHYYSGGIFDDTVNSSTYETGTLILTNTILANSTGGDCYTESGLASEKNNLIDDTGTYACDLTNGVNGDIIGSDPNLGPLADNGGPTQTMALQTGSVAIDAGDDAICAADPVNNLDQRGVTRPQGTHCDIGAFEVEVTNTAPTANPGGPYLGAVNTTVQFDGSASSDPDGDTLTYAWDFGDGSNGSSDMPSNSYAEVGIYHICLTVNDGTVDSDPICTIAVIYDPSAGFVSGGGWIISPEGAYTADPSLTGKATFGFVSKYKKGASVPAGTTAFAFDLAGFEFYSDSYEWLVVNGGGTNAQFKGSGTVNAGLDPNGNPYKFMLWAGDGSPDTFRIRIWWEDASGAENVVYDNGSDQPIGAGNIVVHKDK